MHFNYIFLLTGFYNNDFVPEPSEGYAFIIPLDKPLMEERKRYLRRLSQPSFRFCFGLTENDTSKLPGSQEFKEQLSTFFFLPNYLHVENAYLFFSMGSISKTSAFESIEAGLSEQGIMPLQKVLLDDACGCSSEFLRVMGEKDPAANYGSLLHTVIAVNAVDQYIVIPVADKSDFERKLTFINYFEHWIKYSEPLYSDLILSRKKIKQYHDYLESENKKLKFRIDNFNDYTRLLRETALWHVSEYHRIHNEVQTATQKYSASEPSQNTNHSALYYRINEVQRELDHVKSNRDTILDWYKKEYEILPLWYKRFGHVIKVMMGKRSFKSLYK